MAAGKQRPLGPTIHLDKWKQVCDRDEHSTYARTGLPRVPEIVKPVFRQAAKAFKGQMDAPGIANQNVRTKGAIPVEQGRIPPGHPRLIKDIAGQNHLRVEHLLIQAKVLVANIKRDPICGCIQFDRRHAVGIALRGGDMVGPRKRRRNGHKPGASADIEHGFAAHSLGVIENMACQGYPARPRIGPVGSVRVPVQKRVQPASGVSGMDKDLGNQRDRLQVQVRANESRDCGMRRRRCLHSRRSLTSGSATRPR